MTRQRPLPLRRLFLPACVGALLGSIAPAHAEPPSGAKAEALRILARFNHEPTVVEVQNAAARYARVNPGAYENWLSESNYAHALPRRLLGRVRRTDNDDRSARTTNASTGSLSDTVSARDQLQLEVLAEWDLSRIVFNRDGILAARQVERIVNQREDVLTTVNKLYFARRQLQADLDALTGGWFSTEVAKRTPR
jgi:hypothetical protein